MTVNIKLRSGLILNDATKMIQEKFRQWPWKKYDADKPKNPNIIDPRTDIDRVYRIGARTPKRSYEKMIEQRGKNITGCLQKIPVDAVLEDIDLASLKEPIIELFDHVCGPHIQLAGATKLLYPFRPGLLPIIDSVIDYYYWYATSIQNEDSFRKLESIVGWGEYIYALLILMQNDVKGARDQLDEVRAACKKYDYASVSLARILESLIWFYYSRSGSPSHLSTE